MTLYLRTGFWQLYDLNTYGTARLAWDPDADPAQITADWVRQTLSADPATSDGDDRGAGPLAGGDHQGPLHRTVRRQTGEGARARAAADDVDLRVGHRDRRLRRPRQHLRGQPRPPRRGDRRGRTGGRDRRAHARPGRRHRPGRLALARAATVLRGRARLRDRPAADAGRVPGDGAAPRAVARHRRRGRVRRLAAGRGALPRGARPSTSTATAATWTCPRTTSPPPTSAACGPTATRRWRGSPAACSGC